MPLFKGGGVNRSKFNFYRTYQIEGNNKCSNVVANILPIDPPPPQTLGLGSIGQNSTFSEHSHYAYPIKNNQKYSKLVANI